MSKLDCYRIRRVKDKMSAYLAVACSTIVKGGVVFPVLSKCCFQVILRVIPRQGSSPDFSPPSASGAIGIFLLAPASK